MSGEGSGIWKTIYAKSTTDMYPCIDVRWMNKKQLLKPGTIQRIVFDCMWDTEFSIGLLVLKKRLLITYRPSDDMSINGLVKQFINLERTRCNYGGYRKWFVCPVCKRRVAVLYCSGKYFLCRHCNDLTYKSTREEMFYRLISKARKIRIRLGEDGDYRDPFPDKPKNMHWKTYRKLCDQIEKYETAGVEQIAKHFGVPPDTIP